MLRMALRRYTPILLLLLLCTSCANQMESDLVSAAARGDTENVKLLLAGGANIEAHANDDWTALTSASEKGHLETVKTLLDSGAKVNGQEGGGNTALFWAAFHGHSDIVEVLLAAGADVDLKCPKCLSPLEGAKAGNHLEVTILLERAGAKQ
jgi:uncharacterized protein